jgi:hypothetical protein
MDDSGSLQRFLERALAFAHAALEDATVDNLENARAYADEVLPKLDRLKKYEFTLAEARQIVLLVTQLRTVLSAVDRRIASDRRFAVGNR